MSVAAAAKFEARLNASVLKTLANAQVTLNGVAGVSGIFKRDYVESQGGVGMSGMLPTFTLLSSDVPANPVGKVLVNGAQNYVVAVAEPDTAGMTRLVLERTV